MPSRDPELLDPQLRQRWNCCCRDWKVFGIPGLEVRVSCTYRSLEEQAKEYAKGRTSPGPVVTKARPGRSPHNFDPSLALDFFFVDATGEARWDAPPYLKMGVLARKYGLEWGGRFRIRDYPHIEVPGFDWRKAAAGTLTIDWPPMPEDI